MAECVSKSFTKTDWLSIRTQLKDKGVIEDNWKKAIKLIYERVTDRYLNPLRMLVDNEESYKGAGFSIATIECSLIEFIAALTEGKIFLKDKPQGVKDYYYDDSARLYHRFLRTSNIFGNLFAGKQPHYRPDDFYKNVRCALVHEAQTKNKWEIKVYGKTKTNDLKNTTIIETDNEGRKILYRTAFYLALKKFFDEYCKISLTENSNRGRTLRKYLARKIDHILEIPVDAQFWW